MRGKKAGIDPEVRETNTGHISVCFVFMHHLSGSVFWLVLRHQFLQRQKTAKAVMYFSSLLLFVCKPVCVDANVFTVQIDRLGHVCSDLSYTIDVCVDDPGILEQTTDALQICTQLLLLLAYYEIHRIKKNITM